MFIYIYYFSHFFYASLPSFHLLSLSVSHTLSLHDALPISAEKGVQLFLASDVIVADKFAPDANNKVIDA